MYLKLNEIKKHFGEKEVLKGASFTFEKGNIYGLLGRNGAGKTTLFNCLSGELPCDEGTAKIINENNVARDLAQSDVGYVLSTPVVPDFLTGYEFVKFFLEVTNKKDNTNLNADYWLELMNIELEDRHLSLIHI